MLTDVLDFKLKTCSRLIYSELRIKSMLKKMNGFKL